jgi:hypothetical protein
MLTLIKSIEVKNLGEAIEKLGTLICRELTLFLWTDTDSNCAPIVEQIKIKTPDSISEYIGKNILIGLNQTYWILAIMDEHNVTYKLIEPLKYSNKKCVI